MKRIIFIANFLVLSLLAFGQMDKTQLQLHSFAESKSSGGIENIGAMFQKNWPREENTGQDCAWIRVTFENMKPDDARNVSFIFGSNAYIVEKRDRLAEAEREIWLFVSPVENTFIEAKIRKFGTSNRIPNIKLEPKHVYDLKLKNDKTVSVSIASTPEGINAKLETGQTGITPVTFSDVTLGRHLLTFEKDGEMISEEQIIVSEENVSFGYDLRKTKVIKFDSDPSKASVLIDGIEMGRTPFSQSLPYGKHEVKMRYGVNERDSITLEVDDNTAPELKLELLKKKDIEVIAIHDGKKVNANLYVDGKLYGNSQPSYVLSKPVGTSCRIKMAYSGTVSKEHELKFTSHTKRTKKINIDPNNKTIWPWESQSYNRQRFLGFSVGYVTKQLTSHGDGYKFSTDGAWNKLGHYLHGVQIGARFQPHLDFGLGLHTGLFYEFYYSKNSDAEKDDHNLFMEHCLYTPIHLSYSIPFSDKVALFVHGGPGLSYSLWGGYVNNSSDIDDNTHFYGKDGYPKKFNATLDIGIGLRIKKFQFDAQYGKGLNDHKTYTHKGSYKTRQNRMSLAMSYMLEYDDDFWPWNREFDYDDHNAGVEFGYVNKQLVSRGNGKKFKEDGGLQRRGRFMHGASVGGTYRPSLECGLGLYTGLFFEMYFSFADSQKGSSEDATYTELGLYMPIHANYRIPFNDNAALSIHAGPGLGYAFSGEVEDAGETEKVLGEEGHAKAFNLTLDIGLSMRYKNVMFNFQYGKGMLNHKSYDGMSTKENRMSLGMSVFFGDLFP